MEKNARQLYDEGSLEISRSRGDKVKGRALLKQSADAGCKVAMYKYAETCEDKQQRIELYKIAADKGCGKAAYMLGCHYALLFNEDVKLKWYTSAKYFLKAYSCGVTPEFAHYGDDRDSCISASQLKDIIGYFVDHYAFSGNPYDVIPLAMDAYEFGAISERELQEVKEFAARQAGVDIRYIEARICPKCGTFSEKIEERKELGKGIAVAAVGLLTGPIAALVGAGIGALVAAKKEYCTCQKCGHTWRLKMRYETE